MTPGDLPLVLHKGATFGPVIIYAREEDQTTPVDLTGWFAHAKVRTKASGPVKIDLLPTVTNGPTGEITIPEISDEATAAMVPSCNVWDLLLERPSGEILGPFLAGTFTIDLAVSRA